MTTMSAQVSVQTANYPSAFENPRFSFLAKPPPQKRRPGGAPLPPPPGSPPPVPHQLRRKLSNANSGIIAWATHVQPGSPAPRSPHRRLSITSSSSRRSSISRLNRRPSISHNRAASGSSSFMHIIDTTPTRTPSTGKFDLTTLGYASVFVQFPKTPTTPSPYLREHHQRRGDNTTVPLSPKPPTPGPLSAHAFVSIPIPPIPEDTAVPKRKGMKRFRSLSLLRPRSSKAKAQATGPSPRSPISPTKTSISVAKAARKQELEAAAAAITQRKQTKYPASKSVVRAPPTLANELALMQFADGGSIESHAKRVMEAQAKATRGCAAAAAGVSDVYRDGQGGLWWDADEEMEYAPLLGGKTAQEVMKESQDALEMEMDWEEFADTDGAPSPLRTHASRLRAADRASVSTQDSDLDPARLLPLPEHEDRRTAAMDDRALASQRIGGPGMSVLSLPSRPRRAVPHLRAPATFLVDVAAFAPRSPGPVSTAFLAASSTRVAAKVRRRPAPLKLASSAYAGRSRRSPLAPPLSARRAVPSPMLSVRAAPSPGGVEKTRREFLEGSFAPMPVPMASPELANVPCSILIGVDSMPNQRTERSTKRKGVRGLFGIARRTD